MTFRPPGTLRVLALLAKNSLLRLLRASQVRKARRQTVPGEGSRSGRSRRPTRRKRGDGLAWLLVLMLPLFAFQSLMMTGQAVVRLGVATEQYSELRSIAEAAVAEPAQGAPTDEDQPRYGGRYTGRRGDDFNVLTPARVWTQPGARERFVQCGALLLLTLLSMLVAIGFGGANANLAGGEWTQAWLMTFPVPTRSLVLAKGLEYSLVTFFPWLTLCPLTYQLLRALGHPWALPAAVGATLATTFLVGSARLYVETRLRLSCSLRALRSVQGACTLTALLLMALVFGIALGPSIPSWFLDLGGAAPAWLVWSPGAWPLAMAEHGAAAALAGVGLTGLVFVLATSASTRLLAHGAMRTGGVDAGARGRAGAWQRARRLGVAGKDLALLLRDRNFLVQTVFVPVFVIGLQLLVNPGLGKVQGSGVAMLAYGIGLYSLIGGCFQVLAAEGRSLWMLYSLPVAIGDALRQKTRIWATLAVLFAWIGLAAFAIRGGQTDLGSLLVDALLVGYGVWCAAHIAAGISVIGCNPNADHVPRQPKARHVYLYFFFASTFFVGLHSAELAPRLATMLVFGTLAYAIWQRACDRLPWLLDPVEEPRRAVALFDGSAALLVFFLLQALLSVLLMTGSIGDGLPPWSSILLAFVIAGAVTVVSFVVVLTRRGVDVMQTLGLRVTDGRRVAVDCGLGLLAGVGLGMLGLAYLQMVREHGWFELPPAPGKDHVELLLLAVVAAPLVEEVLFRGLVFGGLVRSVRVPLAVVWSAALFACVHPVASWPPVFLMGVVAAVVFQRTRFLPAAMLVHASYNFVVLCC
ncbi:MAG: CPBP family intramembrane metalloprotease [Planctomycetes bacterium]|nr:CPBP family intramembrane metalloprotease [Planctomycetota bacterium]